ncbi:MAG TPA: carboxylating nicotinate-nucleotide diphosphorylase [bacterium (Candidatus Stahlbacteria)]|nr:carboxylating nicotinate-nucleotide diphosphorylase [Candidatus Stahlbacteria bacterium]
MRGVDQKIREALREDIGTRDITSQKVIKRNLNARGTIVAKANGILCGIDIVERVFEFSDPNLIVKKRQYDGAEIIPGMVVAVIKGRARSILRAERVALNFLQQLSGIATTTRKFVDAVSGTGCVILDTRKTHPGLREVEKYAVRVGGGENHRMSLDKMILVKDNHIALAGGIGSVISKLEGESFEIEVKNLEELDLAVRLRAKRVMLDNFSLREIEEAVKRFKGKVTIEVSGGVNLRNVREIAETGVDYISVGALTHSAQAIDFSLELEPMERR